MGSVQKTTQSWRFMVYDVSVYGLKRFTKVSRTQHLKQVYIVYMHIYHELLQHSSLTLGVLVFLSSTKVSASPMIFTWQTNDKVCYFGVPVLTKQPTCCVWAEPKPCYNMATHGHEPCIILTNNFKNQYVYIYIYIYMFVYIYICMYIYIYIYVWYVCM